MKAYLFYSSFFQVDQKKPVIGGVETYICDLAELLKLDGYDVEVVQSGDTDAEYEWNGYMIRSISVGKQSYRKCIERYVKKYVQNEDLVIFMTHSLNCKIKHQKTISIQHGIYWDIPYSRPRAIGFVEFLFRNFHSWKDIRLVNLCKNCVAVDYNFLNWYKTQQYFMRSNIEVIPNYCTVSSKLNSRENKEKVKILFARRFCTYRGTRIFGDAAARILAEYANVEVTLAGNGPDEAYLRELFQNDSRVHFICYGHGESQQVHEQHDIAVVSSIGSEGTSLSLLEAMGAGCAVVCTNVGGLTNIVIDGYNGLMCDITADSLYSSLKTLVENPEIRSRLAECGYQTAKSAFNKKDWQEKWNRVIEKVSSL